jgi:hypothetical protein
VTRRAISCPQLEDDHVHSILRIIQALCRNHSVDHEASIIIQELLCGMYHYVCWYISVETLVILFQFFLFLIDKCRHENVY